MAPQSESRPVATNTTWVSVAGDFGRYAGGGLFVLSAVLKYLFPDFSTTEATGLSVASAHVALAAGELALGLAVLFRLFGGVEATLALVAYAVFTGVNGWSVAVGRDSCGCLGSVTVSPWVMLAVDAAVVLGLVVYLRVGGARFGVRVRRALAVGAVALFVVGAGRLAGGREAVLATMAGSDVYLESATVDLGQRKPGETVEAVVRVRNRSPHTVRVVGLTDSATLRPPAEWPEIGAGADGPVGVTVLAKGEAGRRQTTGSLFVDVGGQLRRLPFRVVWVVSAP